MRTIAALPNIEPPYLVRLKKLVMFTQDEIDSLIAAGRLASSYAARREIIRFGARISGPKILMQGWAARVRDFQDGRRQILNLLLPGEMISIPQEVGAFAATTTLALTDVTVAPAPIAENNERGLGQAYAISADIERICLLRQIARIGRLDAYERLADLFLELNERLELAGLAASNGFGLPLTQEMLADCLGLTSVHVNRTLKQMRQQGMLDDRRRTVKLIDADHLHAMVDYRPLTSSRSQVETEFQAGIQNGQKLNDSIASK